MYLTAYFGDGLVAFGASVMTKLADDPWDVRFGKLRVLAIRPETLGVKFLERTPGQFEAALPDFLRWFHHAHVLKANHIQVCKQAGLWAGSVLI
jgi:hypothetical protein